MARDPNLPEYSYTRRRGRPAVDPALRRIALVAGVVTVAVIVVALAWSDLRPRLGLGGGPPLVLAPATPLRVAPANPGGLTVPGANEQIMSGAAPAPPELAPVSQDAEVSQLQQAANAPAPAAGAGAAKPASSSAPAAPATTPPAAAPAPAVLPPAAPPAPAAGPGRVQLAATDTEAEAHQMWWTLKSKAPDLLAGRMPVFIPATVSGKAVWRLRINGFADQTAARAFCQAMIARGAACAVAAF